MSEEATPYGTPSYLEKVQSQLPALQLLTEMGWEYLTPEECNQLRGDRLGTVILEPILTDPARRARPSQDEGEIPSSPGKRQIRYPGHPRSRQ